MTPAYKIEVRRVLDGVDVSSPPYLVAPGRLLDALRVECCNRSGIVSIDVALVDRDLVERLVRCG